jgi:hypothetical protein
VDMPWISEFEYDRQLSKSVILLRRAHTVYYVKISSFNAFIKSLMAISVKELSPKFLGKTVNHLSISNYPSIYFFSIKNDSLYSLLKLQFRLE